MKEFEIKKVSVLLNPLIDISFEDYQIEVIKMIERAKKFMESGGNHEKAGLNPNKYVVEVV